MRILVTFWIGIFLVFPFRGWAQDKLNEKRGDSASHSSPADLPTPEKLGYQSFDFRTAELGEVHYYVKCPDDDRNRPLLVYLDGSGPYPLFHQSTRGISSTVPLQGPEFSRTFNLLLISKPGVPFVDHLESKPGQPPEYPAPEEYNLRLSLDWRVNAVRGAIDDLVNQRGFRPAKIAALGISEGYQVGARLAACDSRITHLGLLVGNGLNQFYDFMIEARQQEARGELSVTAAQSKIDAILHAAEDIYAHPESTDQFWMGHTYKRWSSFCRVEPATELAQLDIPIFIGVCSQDRNTSVLSAEYIRLDFPRRGKKNLTFLTYPYDHSFSQPKRDEAGQVIGSESHLMNVLNEWLKWYQSQSN